MPAGKGGGDGSRSGKGSGKGSGRGGSTGASSAVPAPLRWLVVVVTAEGVALTLLAAVYTARVIGGAPQDRGVALFGAGIGVAGGLVLLLLARGLWRRRRAALAPLVLLQLLAMPVGFSLLKAGEVAIGLAVVVPAAVTLGLLFGTAAGRESFAVGEPG